MSGHDDFLRKGYARLPGVLPPDEIARLRTLAAEILGQLSQDHRAANRSQGSLVSIATDDRFAPLAAHPSLRAAFERLGYRAPRLSSGFLISKPGNSPALFWHQDWWGWDLELSYGPEPAQIGAMIYLTDTRVQNGCLRVIPGSHRRPHPIHASIRAHDEGLSRVDDPDHPLYRSVPDEVPVEVRAGDLVLIDSRLLHSAYPNTTGEERSLLTLWYHPYWERLPEPVRSRVWEIVSGRFSDLPGQDERRPSFLDWPEEARAAIAPVMPDGGSDAPPLDYNRRPRWAEAAGA